MLDDVTSARSCSHLHVRACDVSFRGTLHHRVKPSPCSSLLVAVSCRTTNPNGGPSENYDGTLDYPTFWNTAVAASFYTWNYVGFNTFAGANDAT